MTETQTSDSYKEVFDYDALVLDGIGRAEETMNKLALQNYTFCGLVIAAHFAKQVPFIPAAITIGVLSLLFAIMMAAHSCRFKYLFAMHRMAQDAWLTGKSRSDLDAELRKNQLTRQILDMRVISPKDYFTLLDFGHPAVFAALLPLFGAIAWFIVGPSSPPPTCAPG